MTATDPTTDRTGRRDAPAHVDARTHVHPRLREHVRRDLRPGNPAICPGVVLHHRHRPESHRFTYAVNQVWLDPDDPGALFDRHRLWSATGPAPIRFARADYFDGRSGPIGPALRALAAEATGRAPTGAIRLLTQPRTWGWLFNPISVYLLWDDEPNPAANPGGAGVGTRAATADVVAAGPAAAVLEVTNTPWKERHHYPLALRPTGGEGPPTWTAVFDKALHVSPFLTLAHHYRLTIGERSLTSAGSTQLRRRLTIDLDVVPGTPAEPVDLARIRPPGRIGDQGDDPILTTRLVVDRTQPTPLTMTRALFTNPAPTHRVSAGIHRQALALWRKGVPFVPHPKRRTPHSSDGVS